MNNIKEFQVGDYIDTSNLNKEEKRILAEVMRNNGIVEEYKPIENYSYPYWVIDSGMQIDGAKRPTQDKLKKELTPEQAVFVGAPDWATVIVESPHRNHVQYMESVEKGKQRLSHIISEEGFGEEGITISSHGWDESKIIFKREDVKVNNSVDKQIEKLQQELDELKQQRELEQQQTKSKQWEPQGGSWYINVFGEIDRGRPTRLCRNFGVERPTEALALKTAKKMRQHNRLLAYVHEHAPEYEYVKDNEDGWEVYFDDVFNEYSITEAWRGASLLAIIMPKHVAEKLCQQLNDGSVVL